MVSPDIAFAVLLDRTAQAFRAAPPVYMTYRERTHVTGANRMQDINRSIAVRVSDDLAVMHDLPDGSERTGPAFPIIAYFDPASSFQFNYYANLKRVDINVTPAAPWIFKLPTSDPAAIVTVPYSAYFTPTYAPDSTDAAVHLLVAPTPRFQGFYPAEIIEDPRSALPSRMVMRSTTDDEEIALDYQIVDGHWLITHGVYSATQHVSFMSFKVIADITFDEFTFPTVAPDPRLAGTPAPTATPSPAAQ